MKPPQSPNSNKGNATTPTTKREVFKKADDFRDRGVAQALASGHPQATALLFSHEFF